MFFKQIRRNAARNRKTNGLYFGSLIIAVIAFYTLLSLDKQDVMQYLSRLESVAIAKLMALVPAIYVVSLFFVFFLIYFACHYQLNSRRKEFGLYLMLGMKRSRLFAMLMGESLLNGIISVLIGLPIALLLTETISLTTAKLIGLGLIVHQISFSASALLWTIAGFILVQLFAMLFLCAKFSRMEPAAMLAEDSAQTQKAPSLRAGWLCFILGLVLLAAAYVLGVTSLKRFSLFIVGVILILGIVGTFLLYRGMGASVGHSIRKRAPRRSGLFTFTGRQIQENVLCQHKALAVASLLILLSLSCIAYGIGICAGTGQAEARTADFSIQGDAQAVEKLLESEESQALIASWYPLYLGHGRRGLSCSSSELTEALLSQSHSDTDLHENIVENLPYRMTEYFIAESSYNHLLESVGETPLSLGHNQAALYTSMKDSSFTAILNAALQTGVSVTIDGEDYALIPRLYCNNVVADRQITLYSALILPDDRYEELTKDSGTPFCYNANLRQDVTDELGLILAIEKMQDVLDPTGLIYESYLSGIGRNLFYTVAGSYITIYLGILFMIIANTVIGLKYMMQLQATRHRYATLLMLGADIKELCRSSQKQILLFFVLVLSSSALSSVFAIWSMFNSLMRLPAGTSVGQVALLSAIAIILFLAIEWIYVTIIERTCRKEILALSMSEGGSALV